MRALYYSDMVHRAQRVKFMCFQVCLYVQKIKFVCFQVCLNVQKVKFVCFQVCLYVQKGKFVCFHVCLGFQPKCMLFLFASSCGRGTLICEK